MIETRIGELPVMFERHDGQVKLGWRQKLAFVRRFYGLPAVYADAQQAYQFTPPQCIDTEGEPDIGSVCWYNTPLTSRGNIAISLVAGHVMTLGDQGEPVVVEREDQWLGFYRGWSWFLGTTLLPNAPREVTYHQP